MPELEGQMQSGSPMSERDCYQRALFHLNGLRTSLRGLVAARRDMRWLLIVRILDQIEDNIRKLMVKGGSRIVWLPRDSH